MKPPLFAVLRNNYSGRDLVPQDALFAEIGWGDLIGNPTYHNTCAIRVSLALIKSGVILPGRMKIKNGPYKGYLVEPGQAALSRLLVKAFGEPERYKSGAAADAGTKMRNGIVSFWVVAAKLRIVGRIGCSVIRRRAADDACRVTPGGLTRPTKTRKLSGVSA